MSQKVKLEQLIREAKTTNSLELSNDMLEVELDEIPNEVFDLQNLEELLINKIPLQNLSKKILNFGKLKRLSLVKTNLNKFPSELGKLEELNYLFIQSNPFASVPKGIMNWKNLEYLFLGECTNLTEINGLPPTIQYLNITDTGLKNMPEMVFDLIHLRKLVASNLNIHTIPEKLFKIISLQSLFIEKNNLKFIQDDIQELQQLKQLWLGSNEFSEFPISILNLRNLFELNLAGNFLNKIPNEITELKTIEILELGANNFTRIPSQLFGLNSLRELSFGNYPHYGTRKINKIKIIPDNILKLKHLNKLDLFENDIENIPKEILDDSLDAIKNYIQSKIEADSELFLHEAKMVMVGRGNVGKTVLTKKLTIPNYTLEKSDSTKGISILKNPFVLKFKAINDETFKFTIWDFGGQEKYDATHQLFITDRSVYLFITEAREESNYLDFYYWLNAINFFSNNSPVIIVLSKYDERRKDLHKSIYKEKFNNIIDFVDLSCADGYEYTIEALKEAIKLAVERLPQTKQRLSNRWVDIRIELEKLSVNKDYIEYEEYIQLCAKHKLDKVRADFLSQFLNDLGAIIHHQHDLLLKKTVFINPEWCVDGIYKVLDDENVFDNKGRFTSDDLVKIWSGNKFDNKQAELLRLMCEYGLCFELKDGSGFIAPDLLSSDKPEGFEWNFTSNLQFEFRYEFMPAGMLSRFIVKSHAFIKGNLYWKYGVVLEHDNTKGLIEEDYINGKIKISVHGQNKKALLSATRMYIEEVHKDFGKANSLIFEEMVPCNCSECSKGRTPHFYKFKVLKKFEQKLIGSIPCENSGEPVEIKALINDVQLPGLLQSISNNEEFKQFIYNIISTVLEKEIMMKGGYINFWRDQQCRIPKNETEFQAYISNTLDNYCKVNGIQLSREAKEANGSVDVVFSYTNHLQQILKVCVEIKKAHHQDVYTAINTQLPLYMQSAATDAGIYLIIWFKHEGFNEPQKYESEEELSKLLNLSNKSPSSILIKIINCCKRISPSKNSAK